MTTTKPLDATYPKLNNWILSEQKEGKMTTVTTPNPITDFIKTMRTALDQLEAHTGHISINNDDTEKYVADLVEKKLAEFNMTDIIEEKFQDYLDDGDGDEQIRRAVHSYIENDYSMDDTIDSAVQSYFRKNSVRDYLDDSEIKEAILNFLQRKLS